jgi:ubiquinone/menaquinone biosynthesis C-methylase UbiE
MHQPLTQRQQRELDYHREHAQSHTNILDQPFSWDVLQQPGARWWNAYWGMFEYLVNCGVKGKKVLVVGCGFGDDALRLAKLGAHVSAFDLSPDSLRIARQLARREQLTITFEQMPAEAMRYADNSFDFIVARDILHHVDIPQTMAEIERVAKPGAVFVVNEIYSHSWTDKVRHSAFVDKFAYPRMRRLIYGASKPYITADERKLSEHDMRDITRPLQNFVMFKHFNFLVTRLVPDRFEGLARLDRLLLRLLKPFGGLLAGRVLFSARFAKSAVGAPQAATVPQPA